MPVVEGFFTCEKHRQEKKNREQNNRFRNQEGMLLNYARARAKREGMEFTITKADIIIPAFCRYLNIPLIHGIGAYTDNSPTLDRMDTTKGYIIGNVEVISYKANRMKSNATQEELLSFAKTVDEDFINKWKNL